MEIYKRSREPQDNGRKNDSIWINIVERAILPTQAVAHIVKSDVPLLHVPLGARAFGIYAEEGVNFQTAYDKLVFCGIFKKENSENFILCANNKKDMQEAILSFEKETVGKLIIVKTYDKDMIFDNRSNILVFEKNLPTAWKEYKRG